MLGRDSHTLTFRSADNSPVYLPSTAGLRRTNLQSRLLSNEITTDGRA